MDTESLVNYSRARFYHAAAKRLIKEKYEARMLFAYRGGMWRAGPELLTMLQCSPKEDEIVMLDLYENPVKIDPMELQGLAFARWQEQMNAWLIEYEEINNKR